MLLKNCLESIRDSIQFEYEVVIADFGSTDYNPKEWTRSIIPTVNIVDVKSDKFSRGLGLNIAVQNSQYNNLLLLDADMIVCPRLIKDGFMYLSKNQPFFPICYMYTDHTHTKGFWNLAGFGICFVTKKMYDIVGGVPSYNSWGREDTDFFAKLNKLYNCQRFTVNGFVHQWHPDDYQWKNKYYDGILSD